MSECNKNDRIYSENTFENDWELSKVHTTISFLWLVLELQQTLVFYTYKSFSSEAALKYLRPMQHGNKWRITMEALLIRAL